MTRNYDTNKYVWEWYITVKLKKITFQEKYYN